MKLSYEKITYNKVNVFELGDFIKKIYNREYDIIVNEGWGNRQWQIMAVDRNKNESYDKEDIENWIKGKDIKYILEFIMNDLVDKGFLEPGQYLIECFW